MIDCSTDVTTLPSKDMIKFMSKAKVGDESSKEDPSVNELLSNVCKILKKEDAIFLPTVTMGNAITFMATCGRGDIIYLDKTSHALLLEGGGASSLCGAVLREVNGINGIFDINTLKNTYLFEFSSNNIPKPSLILVEQSTNLGGGMIWPIEKLNDLHHYAQQRNIAMHMDGARLFNACVASGRNPFEYTQHVDSVCIDFAKGLGAPMGAVLAGNKDFIQKCWKYKIQLGGGMHQIGFMAKACTYALENNLLNLEIDNQNAKKLGYMLSDIPSLKIKPDAIETNILFFTVEHPKMNAFEFSRLLKEKGIKVLPLNDKKIRIVTSSNVRNKDIAYIYENIRHILETTSRNISAFT